MKNMADLMRQAQQMQETIALAQKELETLMITGSAGGDLITITMSCDMKNIQVTLKADFSKEELSVMEDLTAAAIGDALRKISKAREDKMGAAMPGNFLM